MAKKDDDFLKRLRATFRVEAAEHVQSISACLVEMEKSATPEKQAELTEVVFREAHSLKGAARAVSIGEIERVCQSLESVLAALKKKEIGLAPQLFDLLHGAVASLEQSLAAIERDRTPAEKAAVESTIRKLEDCLKSPLPEPSPVQEAATIEKEAPAPEAPAAVAGKPPAAETVRIAAARLESMLLEAEELLSAKTASDELVRGLRELTAAFSHWEAEWTKVHPEIIRLRHRLEKDGADDGKTGAGQVLEFLDWNHSHIRSLENAVNLLAKHAGRDSYALRGMVDTLTEDVKKVLMSPFRSVVEVFPRLVRDLARERGKDVTLVLEGEDIEVDRRVLEELKAPLTHLVRNCIDHGIETPELRKQKGKPACGTVTLAISQKGSSNIEIVVSDDGAGIDAAAVKAAAVKRGVIGREEADRLSQREALSLVYRSGVSTSPIITDISGRGLGLAIVREKVERVRGTVSVDTAPGVHTTFRIVVPSALAEFRGLVVRAAERLFIVPTTSVERAVRVKRAEVKTVENREVLPFDGQMLSLVRLSDVLQLPREDGSGDGRESFPVLVLSSAGKRLAFAVDEVVGEQEVLVKSLGRQLARVPNVAGASVLATGNVVLVLNVADLMKSAVVVRLPLARQPGAAAPERQTILVAEDSITARTLLKSILESAGYRVKTAVDGADAFAALKTESFDLVVSDVDMPRLNGFDLTAKIRADKKLSEIPVVLVTALESREHRERGVEAGADAYIVKSSFDQSNLIEVIRRLI